MDRIEIDGIHVMAVVGTLPHEREAAQPLQIDLALEGDLRDSGRSDELADTVDYGVVTQRIVALAREAKALLLERLAHRLALDVLSFSRVEAVEVRVAKLCPPVPQQVRQVAVRIRRTRTEALAAPGPPHRALIGLGSNLGDRAGHLRTAVRDLGPVAALSQVFESDPIGGPPDAGRYLNMVVALDTDLDPYALLRRCQRIEGAAGRRRGARWDSRTLDLDLLFYDDLRIDDPELTVPHPRYAERRFVLAPLSEVAPERCPAGWEARLAQAGVIALGPLEDLRDQGEPGAVRAPTWDSAAASASSRTGLVR